jgi:hypothetical protein
MVSQLLRNDKISFVAARNFSSRGKEYQVGDDFPQEDARDIEVFVRARYVIPVVEDPADKQHIRHWHRHIRPKDEVVERLGRERVQLRMPDEYDSDEVVDIGVLTHPHTTPEPEGEGESALPEETTIGEPEAESESASEEPEVDEYDPGEYTVVEVNTYIEEHPDEADEVRARERNGRGRKGILEE